MIEYKLRGHHEFEARNGSQVKKKYYKWIRKMYELRLLFSELCKSASVIEEHGKCYINCIKQSGITIL